jgi:ribonuclease D
LAEPSAPRIVTSPPELAEVAGELAGAARVAFDLESNGLFAYRPRICTLQLEATGTIAIVDAIATTIAPLGELLGERGPIKIVHDVSFDARMLAEVGVPLGNVHDTSIAARMLGRTATGLASLLASELGLSMDKTLQHHDWSARPLEALHVDYLAKDVAHLDALEEVLWRHVVAAGIEAEVLEETRYRLASAIASVREPDARPPWTRLKGIERAPAVQLAILRRLCEAREREAMRLDVPPYKVIGNEALVEIATVRPTSRAELQKIRGASHGRAAAMVPALLRAVETGIHEADVPEDERAWLERPRIPSDVAKARRAREARVMAWRKAEAARRAVDEQVVLPGHCVKDLAEPEAIAVEEIAMVPGFGVCRAHYAPAIALALRGQPNENVGG